MTLEIRKRLKRREEADGVRFLTFSCYRRLPLLGTDALRGVFAAALTETVEQFQLRLYAWVVMPEHGHLLLRSPAVEDADVPAAEFLASLKRKVAKRVLTRWREVDAPVLEKLRTPGGAVRFWQPGGGFDRNTRSDAELTKAIRYIHRNPVERGLVERPESWRFSSVHWWLSGGGDRADGRDSATGVPCTWPPGKYDWRRWKGFV